MSRGSSAGGGVGFLGLLTIVLITLKLLGKIDWDWVNVFIPLWGPLALVVAVLAVIAIPVLVIRIFTGIQHWFRDRRRKKK